MSCSRSGCIAILASCALRLADVPAAMARMIRWTGATNDSWHTAGNWSPNRVPQAGDEVVIPEITPDVTITYSGGAVLTNNLTSAEALNITSGVLTVAAAAVATCFTVNAAARSMTLTNGRSRAALGPSPTPAH